MSEDPNVMSSHDVDSRRNNLRIAICLRRIPLGHDITSLRSVNTTFRRHHAGMVVGFSPVTDVLSVERYVPLLGGHQTIAGPAAKPKENHRKRDCQDATASSLRATVGFSCVDSLMAWRAIQF